ncbi:hypothetical protein B296_00018549 [Ensete ventricosum]|uniref:Uncharacterized protein n=1 Tax=Ensete ventricosum TaxID=4639 RepID=A0A427AZS0_ENSVE|nr:hypothetical protein B296_00018549 [Ensete ventricosum]
MLACKAAEQVYEAVVFAFAHDGHWVEIGAGAGAGAAAGAKLAAAVAVELPVPVAGAGLEAGPGLEAELGDEVETAHMKKSAAVLGLMAEGQLASEIGHPVGRVAVDIEHSVDIAADKGHSHGTSDSTAGIAIVVAGTVVEALVPVLQLVHRQLSMVTEEVAAGSAVGVAAEAAGVARAAVVVVALAAEAVDAGAAEEATLGSWETACDDVVEA